MLNHLTVNRATAQLQTNSKTRNINNSKNAFLDLKPNIILLKKKKKAVQYPPIKNSALMKSNIHFEKTCARHARAKEQNGENSYQAYLLFRKIENAACLHMLLLIW
jgi:hypothetical protein